MLRKFGLMSGNSNFTFCSVCRKEPIKPDFSWSSCGHLFCFGCFENNSKPVPAAKPGQTGDSLPRFIKIICPVCHKGNNIICRKESDIANLPVDNLSALHLAAESGHIGIVKYLLEIYPELFGLKDSAGKTVLLLAADANQFAIVTFLLFEHGENLKVKQDNDAIFAKTMEVFDRAAKNGQFELIRAVLKANPALVEEVCCDFHQFTLLYQAVDVGNFELAKFLTEKYRDKFYSTTKDKGKMMETVQNALVKNHMDLAELLLETYPDLVELENESSELDMFSKTLFY